MKRYETRGGGGCLRYAAGALVVTVHRPVAERPVGGHCSGTASRSSRPQSQSEIWQCRMHIRVCTYARQATAARTRDTIKYLSRTLMLFRVRRGATRTTVHSSPPDNCCTLISPVEKSIADVCVCVPNRTHAEHDGRRSAR